MATPSNFALAETKIPANLQTRFLHSLIDSALMEISSASAPGAWSTKQQKQLFEDNDDLNMNLTLEEEFGLREEAVRIIRQSRKNSIGVASGDDSITHSTREKDQSHLDVAPSSTSDSLLCQFLLCLETRKSDVDSAFLAASCALSPHRRRLVNFDWTLNYLLSSDQCVRIDEPRTALHLKLARGGRGSCGGGLGGSGRKREHKTLIKSHCLDLSLGDIRKLIGALNQVVAAVDKTRLSDASKAAML